jgi:hypothetical protein
MKNGKKIINNKKNFSIIFLDRLKKKKSKKIMQNSKLSLGLI